MHPRYYTAPSAGILFWYDGICHGNSVSLIIVSAFGLTAFFAVSDFMQLLHSLLLCLQLSATAIVTTTRAIASIALMLIARYHCQSLPSP